jgi:hypothetical protein
VKQTSETRIASEISLNLAALEGIIPCVSSCCYVCVLILLYMCVLILLCMCPHAESRGTRRRSSIGSGGVGEEDEGVSVYAYGSSGGSRGGRGHALGRGGKGGGSRAEALPIAAFRREIVEQLKVHNVVIVVVCPPLL